ncbi:uncharacterized protein V1510DRAFT_411912 [Dipodascopsis tothii]|uniref:uncharacterized protein n=1 Tax=Dipodascopsis tothii TaxID=44089 RepID=UPI0034CF25CC
MPSVASYTPPPEPQPGRWLPLPSIARAVVTSSFTPYEADAPPPGYAKPGSFSFVAPAPAQPSPRLDPHLLPLSAGDEVYVFEFHSSADWFRGYLVSAPPLTIVGTGAHATRSSALGLTSDAASDAPSETSAPMYLDQAPSSVDPRVYLGVFPARCIAIKEHFPLATPVDTPESLAYGSIPPMAEDGGMPPATPPLFASRLQARTAPALPPPPPPLFVDLTTTPDEPLVDEIAATLREWYPFYFQILFSNRNYAVLSSISSISAQLHQIRLQLLKGILTQAEARDSRKRAVWLLVKGNKLLSGQIIVRDVLTGAIVTGNSDFVKFYQDQQLLALSTHSPSTVSKTTSQTQNNLLHLLGTFKSFVSRASNANGTPVLSSSTFVTFYICSKHKVITEAHQIALNSSGMLQADESPSFLFSNLPSALSKDDLFLVAEVYEYGAVTVAASTPAFDLQASQQQQRSSRMSTLFSSGTSPSSSSLSLSSSSFSPSKSKASKITTRVRKGVAIGVVDIGRVLREQAANEREIVVRMFASVTPTGPSNASYSSNSASLADRKAGWGSLRKRLVKGLPDGIEKSNKADKVNITLRFFASPSSDQLVAAHPALFTATPISKTLFTTNTSERRDEMYITLGGVQFSNFSAQSSSYTAATAAATAARFPSVKGYYSFKLESKLGMLQFSSASNVKPSQTWESCVVTRDETVGEIVRISPLGRGEVVTISVMVYGEVIARGALSLWQDNIITKDGEKVVLLYKDGVPVGRATVHTSLVSTELSADETLLGLIRWRALSMDKLHGEEQLLNVLKQVFFVDENEVVKLVREVFDALFGVLAWKRTDRHFEDAIFSALAHILEVLDRHINLQLVIDEYIKAQFNYPLALTPLLHSFERLLKLYKTEETRVRSALKVGNFILRFMKASWEKFQSRDVVSIELGIFPKDLQRIFNELAEIVKSEDPAVVDEQTLAIQNFHAWLPEVRGILSDETIAKIAVDFMNAGTKVTGKLVLYRLLLMRSFSDIWAFQTPASRKVLALNTLRWLQPYLSVPSDIDHSGSSWSSRSRMSSRTTALSFNSSITSLPTQTASQAWRDQIRLCCSVLAQQFSALWPNLETELGTCGLYVPLLPKIAMVYCWMARVIDRRLRNEYSPLFPSAYPFMMRPIDSSIKREPFDECLTELSLVSAIMSFFSLIDTVEPSPLEADLSEDDAVDLVLNILTMCMSILNCEAFPANWVSIYALQHKAVLACLEFVSLILLENFLPSDDMDESCSFITISTASSPRRFNVNIWRAFFYVLLKLAGSESLEYEYFTNRKRAVVWAIAGDVREQSALLLQKMWNAIGWDATEQERAQFGLEKLGGYQVQFVSPSRDDDHLDNSLVPQILGICLSQHNVLRGVATKILGSMIISELALHSSLDNMFSCVIDSLDKIFKTKTHHPENAAKSNFVDNLRPLFEKHDGDALNLEVLNLLNLIDSLIDLLSQLYSVPADEAYEDDRMLCTLNLMNFLRNTNRQDLFIRYVHQMVQIQDDSGHYVESGLTLKLHAQIYPWSTEVVAPAIDYLDLPEESAFERRERLYLKIIKYFNTGKSWENSIELYKELAVQYETLTFDFTKLAKTLSQMAKLYEDILHGERYLSQFFRIYYLGLGFPKSLRGKQYIVEGMHFERLPEFSDRMQHLYPNAKLLQSSASPVEYLSMEGQFLQISTAQPEADLSDKVFLLQDVSQQVKDHRHRTNLQRFSFSRPLPNSNGGKHTSAVDLWIEKTIFETAQPFPTILRRSEVVRVVTVKTSPLENAVHALVLKTNELLSSQASLGKAKHTNESAVSRLSMLLTGSVDSPVNGGVQQYRLFLQPQWLVDHPDDKELVSALTTAMLDHVGVIKSCLDTHGKVIKPEMRPLHESLLMLFDRNFKNEIGVLEKRGKLERVFSRSSVESGRSLPAKNASSPTTITPTTTTSTVSSTPYSLPQTSATTLAPAAATSHFSLATSATTAPSVSKPASIFSSSQSIASKVSNVRRRISKIRLASDASLNRRRGNGYDGNTSNLSLGTFTDE